MWEEIRKVLKVNQRQLFYNRIPVIAQELKLVTRRRISREKHMAIINDFKKLDGVFDDVKHMLKRKYFPSLRFMALKLCEEHGIQFPMNIPYCRTRQKFKMLNETFYMMQSKIAEDEFDKLWKAV